MSAKVRLPIISFRPFLSGAQKDQAEAARQVDEALRTYGSLYLADHGIPQLSIEGAFQQVRSFFRLRLRSSRQLHGQYPSCSNVIVKVGLYEPLVLHHIIGASPDIAGI